MALRPDFLTDPHVILDPSIRWYPGEELFTEDGYATLLPPLVYKVRQGVQAWRDSGYAGASDTTRALLYHWFKSEHLLPSVDGTLQPFRYFFAQREAVESTIWLYEVEEARDPYTLIKFDSSGCVSKGMFAEDWTRYVMKLATGAGKTKVMSLLIAWAYFHKRYESGSDLSTNFLVIAPNIIVLDRLREDFDGLGIFHNDPVLPENGYEGRDWQNDFQVTLHVQDEIGVVSDTGNIFLTNIHRLYENTSTPSFEDDDTTDYFLGRRPTGKTNQSRVDVGQIVRDVPDLNIGAVSHTTVLDSSFTPSHQSAAGFFARAIMRDLRLVGGFDVLFGKLKQFMQAHLFDRAVDLDDLNVLRNLSEIEVTRAVMETFKAAVNALTVQDKGTTEIRDSIKLSRTRPYVVNDQPYVVPRKSIFNKVVADRSGFELEFAGFLDACDDLVSFVRNNRSTAFRIEYRTADGGIANYYPDFVVKESDSDIWVIETKGREDLEDPLKWARLCQWCEDATKKEHARRFRPLFVRQEQWEKYRPKTFQQLRAASVS